MRDRKEAIAVVCRCSLRMKSSPLCFLWTPKQPRKCGAPVSHVLEVRPVSPTLWGGLPVLRAAAPEPPLQLPASPLLFPPTPTSQLGQGQALCPVAPRVPIGYLCPIPAFAGCSLPSALSGRPSQTKSISLTLPFGCFLSFPSC